MSKICPRCSKEKELTDFHRSTKSPDGHVCYCKACIRVYNIEWHQAHPTYKIDYHRQYKYNLSPEAYENLRKEQGYSCAVCKRHESLLDRSLIVDHDHVTLENRGLLCNDCNTTLGFVREDETVLGNLIEYIRRFKKVQP